MGGRANGTRRNENAKVSREQLRDEIKSNGPRPAEKKDVRVCHTPTVLWT
jgi:hypothetical protein